MDDKDGTKTQSYSCHIRSEQLKKGINVTLGNSSARRWKSVSAFNTVLEVVKLNLQSIMSSFWKRKCIPTAHVKETLTQISSKEPLLLNYGLGHTWLYSDFSSRENVSVVVMFAPKAARLNFLNFCLFKDFLGKHLTNFLFLLWRQLVASWCQGTMSNCVEELHLVDLRLDFFF